MLPFQSRRVVIKLGTGILTSGIGELNTERIAGICRQIDLLRREKVQVAIVSSGAVGLGMGKLGLTKRPSDLARLQACAAVGQGILIQTWQDGFTPYGATVAQLLFTRDDLRARNRHLAARSTIERILQDGLVPVINENDSISAEEIKFGDNDVLSSMAASLIHADYLVILSTAPGLIDLNGNREIVPVVTRITPEILAMAEGPGSVTAVGGMITKLEAARIANRSGCGVFIARGSEPDVLTRIFSGDNPGTFFVPAGLPLVSRKRWLAFFEQPKGTVTVDAGAAEALRTKGGSLLAKGVSAVNGSFQAGEIVNIADPSGDAFARGVAQFSSEELARVSRLSSEEIRRLFPNRKRLEVVHRNSMVMLQC